MNSVYGYYDGENFVPSKRIKSEKKQRVVLKPVKYLGKITDDNYGTLLKALNNGEEVEYEYDDPFFSPVNVKRLTKAIEEINKGTANLTEHELIEVDDDE